MLFRLFVSTILFTGGLWLHDATAAGPEPAGVAASPSPMTGAQNEAAAPGAIEHVCAGTVWPGWAKVDDAADPASPCKSTEPGNPYNVWLIKKIVGYPRHSETEICRVKVVPMGWYRYQYKWDGNRCGHPKEHGEDNIMVIRHDH